MSSLRNAVNRRVHRERDQLQERKNRYGLLEKKKDYRLRAQDHNRKKAQLKNLKKKAEDRNEDVCEPSSPCPFPRVFDVPPCSTQARD
jgi:U3 small nucleolar RNA-associated protein 11